MCLVDLFQEPSNAVEMGLLNGEWDFHYNGYEQYMKGLLIFEDWSHAHKCARSPYLLRACGWFRTCPSNVIACIEDILVSPYPTFFPLFFFSLNFSRSCDNGHLYIISDSEEIDLNGLIMKLCTGFFREKVHIIC